ncbi:tyrosinase-like [Hyla sarda]|uniref:tyrosinase-like n=1 Tax=Hyla sarda TaxID=327740 RepID=UPI0024C429CB|nr:tyrosinase-like [Hyla sarda]
MLVLGVVLLGLAAAADARLIFPKECVKGVTKFPVVCCPMFNGSQCGAAFNRGSCLPVPSSRAVEVPNVNLDDRHNFPGYYFTYMCQCKENFDGFNCGGCALNRDGDNCEKTITVMRRDVRQMSPRERELLFAQINYCKTKIDPDSSILVSGDRFRSSTFDFRDASYYDIWCFIHYYATKPFINNTQENVILNYAHGSSGFLTWHRLYLLYLEKSIQKCMNDPSFALPYYDWGRDPNCSVCTDEMLGGNNNKGQINKNSIFSHWKMVCGNFDYEATYCLMSDNTCERPSIYRNPGAAPGFDKPGALDIQRCLDLTSYDTRPYTAQSRQSFRNCLEGWVDRNDNPGTAMHNLFHVFCGGTMAQVPISCNDPMFFFHHAFVDKIFNVFITTRGLTKNSYPADNAIYGHGAYSCISPFHTCYRHRDMMVPSTQLGYTYSVFNGF